MLLAQARRQFVFINTCLYIIPPLAIILTYVRHGDFNRAQTTSIPVLGHHCNAACGCIWVAQRYLLFMGLDGDVLW